MTPDTFRRIALAHPEAVESAHLGTIDFRVRVTTAEDALNRSWRNVTAPLKRKTRATSPATSS